MRKDAVTRSAFGPPPFRRLLVANRGEIALRIIRACRELGIETVAVYSDADAGTRPVRAADRAIRIGPAPATESYLRVEAIVQAALDAGAEALHPGYGFLSERPSLAEACAAAGLTFVGPEPATLTGLGDKLHARRAAERVGVPVVPGTLAPAPVDRPDAVDDLVAEAEAIGFPLLVKAAAGGGGRGMRLVERARDLPAALAAAAHEARSAFGAGDVYLERRIDGARHVEVQLLGDAEGRIVAVGERDCSTQRRHQKLVEEAPAPGLEPDARRHLHELATDVARAVGLRNAATAEFLLDATGGLWFLEVNARLQVEHGVTELVSGLDLVQEQLWLAAGRPLSGAALAVAADAAHPAQHAIEVRLAAEDPGQAFAPVPGRIGRWRMPSGPGVRVDDWVEDGTAIAGDYDPLLGKLLVVEADRPSAIARMARALDEVEVTGLQTTLPFHRWLMADDGFRAGDLSTELVDQRWRPAAEREAAAGRAATVAAAAFARDAAGTAGTPPAGAASARSDAARSVVRGPDGIGPHSTDSDALGTDATGNRDLAGWLRVGRREGVERWPR